MPNFKMNGPVVSEIIRDILLPLAPAVHPRLPRGRAAGKKKHKLDPKVIKNQISK